MAQTFLAFFLWLVPHSANSATKHATLALLLLSELLPFMEAVPDSQSSALSMYKFHCAVLKATSVPWFFGCAYSLHMFTASLMEAQIC